MGYNYQRRDLFGVLLMIGFCVLSGILIGCLRMRSASVWPCVLAHGALNTAQSTIMVVLVIDPDSALNATLLGWLGWVVLAVLIAALAVAGKINWRPASMIHGGVGWADRPVC